MSFHRILHHHREREREQRAASEMKKRAGAKLTSNAKNGVSPLPLSCPNRNTPPKPYEFKVTRFTSSKKKTAPAHAPSPFLQPQNLSPSNKNPATISDLKDLAASRANSIKRCLDLCHSEILKEIEASNSRLSKRFKVIWDFQSDFFLIWRLLAQCAWFWFAWIWCVFTILCWNLSGFCINFDDWLFRSVVRLVPKCVWRTTDFVWMIHTLCSYECLAILFFCYLKIDRCVWFTWIGCILISAKNKF